MNELALALTRVPDIAGEIIGFRAWRVERVGSRLLLVSRTWDATIWRPDHWTVAACGDPESCGEQPPISRCRCGIYAARDREHLVNLGGYHNDEDEYETIAIGEVGLAGRVVVATLGWRAEKARPIRLWLPYQRWPLAVGLSSTYGIPAYVDNTLRAA